MITVFRDCKGVILWMCCKEGRKLTLEVYIRMLTKFRKQFGLTIIQQKSCFSMKMQG